MSTEFPGVLQTRAPDGRLPRTARVLVTGASGAVGSLLVPRLLLAGHPVRVLGRDPARVDAALATLLTEEEAEALDVVVGDAISGEGLERSLEGVEVAYYLIHSMERQRSGGSPFAERDRLAARNFTSAARRAGVRRIVYLGGLLPQCSSERRGGPVSRHLASREDVERIILEASPGSIALRASIVVGERSRSFRLLVRLVERMPVLTLPSWHRFRTQPIDARDVTEMLAACAHAEVSGRLDIGGPDVISYGEMISTIAELLLIRRPSLRFGVSATPLTARVAAAIAREDPELVLPLMEGLLGDLLPGDDHAAERLGVRLHDFPSAVENALREWEESEPLRAR